MLLSDLIVFWQRHRLRPEFTAEEIEKLQKAQKKRTMHLCKNATARLLYRINVNNAKSDKA